MNLDPDGTAAIIAGVRQGFAFVALAAGSLGLVAWLYRRDRR